MLSFMQNFGEGNFELYSKHDVAMVTDVQYKNRKLRCSGEYCQCVQ
jgi:hypothetical protein